MVYFISPPFGNYISTSYTTSIRGSFTLLPRPGLITRTLLTLRYSIALGGWKNEIGLRNPGLDYAIATYKKGEIISIGLMDDDIDKIVEKIPKDMDIEINVSCPNVERGEGGYNKSLKKFLSPNREWCILKMSPTADLKEIREYYEDGFRQFHLSNTVPLSFIYDNEEIKGGVSGDMVKECNSVNIPIIRYNFPDAVIIGGGGIRSISDIEDYCEMGANHFSFSSVHFNPVTAGILHYNLMNR